MDLSDENDVQTKYYKCKKHLHGSLNVVQKDTERTFLLWNKYQIFLYEDMNFESVAKEFTPEFQINQIIVSNNYLVCVDSNGNVHTTSLKFKNSGQKRFKSSFQPREQGVLHCIQYSPESALSLKLHSDTYYLRLHKINTEFQLEKEVTIRVDDIDMPLRLSDHREPILTCHTISKEHFGSLSAYFEENLWRNNSLVLISFDMLTVYACLISQKSPEDTITLKKLYTSPSEICDIKIIEKQELEVLIALTCGTIVRLHLNSHKNTPEIIHLNTAVSKVIAFKDSIIYSDGMSMWKAENLNSKENIVFQQFFIKDVKDFIECDHQIICTTFTNLIYTFSTENKTSFLNQDKELYCPAEKLVNNSEYLFRINEEIEKNKEIITKINDEGNYLTAVSLSRRQDIMDKMIQEKVILYENYEEVIKDNSEITFAEEIQEYFKTELILILVKISATTIQHSLSNILNNILENLKIHITSSTDGSIIKTNTLKLAEPLKKLHILIPIERQNLTQINVEIKLISEIPGALDRKETVWTILHRRALTLNAEHFIKIPTTNNNINLKETKKNINEMICKTTEEQHGDLFKITDISRRINHEMSLPFYVKLPINFKVILKDDHTFRKHFHTQKANYIQKQLTSEEFLKSKSNVVFEIGKEKVQLEILNDDFNNPLLKIFCFDIKIAREIRDFFGKVFHEDLEHSREEFISNALYTTTENLQKGLKQCSSLEDCLVLAERLQKNVIATLPL